MTGKNVTLNLNGKTVTYDTAATPTLPNGGFEAALAGDPTRPANWNLSLAPAAQRVATTAVGKNWGEYLPGDYTLRMTNFQSATQTIWSDPMDVEAGWEYAAILQSRSSSKTTVRVEIRDASNPALPPLAGAALPLEMVNGTDVDGERFDPTVTQMDSDVGRGFSLAARFTPSVKTKVRMVVTVQNQPDGNTPPDINNVVCLDRAQIVRSRVYGVVAARGSTPTSFPLSLGDVAPTVEDVTVRDGRIVQGGNSYRGDALFLQGGPTSTVERVTVIVSGIDAFGLINTGSNLATVHSRLVVRDSMFVMQADHVTRRMSMTGVAISTSKWADAELDISNNLIINAPLVGILVAETKQGAEASSVTNRINGNIILQKALVSDPYGILINGLEHFEIANNIINRPGMYPDARWQAHGVLPRPEGRGILIEGLSTGYVTEGGHIHDNDVWAYEKPNLEYPSTAYSGGSGALVATALCLRAWDTTTPETTIHRNLLIERNTFSAYADEVGAGRAIGVRLTHDEGDNIEFVENDILAVVASSQYGVDATALSIPAATGGYANIVFRRNNLVSNQTTLRFLEYNTPTVAQTGWYPGVRDLRFEENTQRGVRAGDPILDRMGGDLSPLLPGVADRTATGPGTRDFVTTRMYATSSLAGRIVAGVSLIGHRYEGAATPVISFDSAVNSASEIKVYWTVTVNTQPGALVDFRNGSGQVVSSALADATGKAVLRLHTMTYRRTGPTVLGPFSLWVAGQLRRSGEVFNDADRVHTRSYQL